MENLPDMPLVQGSVGEPLHGASILKKVEMAHSGGFSAFGAGLWGRVGGDQPQQQQQNQQQLGGQMSTSSSGGGPGWGGLAASAQNYLGSATAGWRG